MQAAEPMIDDWIEIGALTDIPRLGSRIVNAPDGDIAIFRNSRDEVFALLNKCPHRGGPLSEGILSGHTVTCPLHNWRIQLVSGEAVAPDKGCVPIYPVKIENGTIYIQL
ncbi:MAG: nitrite reductase small subunit NirD [Chromatiales bacterium]|nr:nitrite reductase small subunit NirD [Chromatiales bacterium]